MAKILLLIANKGYQVKEYEDTKKALLESGHTVITGGMKRGEAISNIMTTTNIDVAIDDLNIDDYDGLYLIGGPLALDYLDNEKVYKFVFDFYSNTNKPFGAICISPRILLNARVMKGIRMTGWNDDGELEDICIEHGATYINSPVALDGRVTTARDPISAYDFGKMISTQFK